MSDQATQGDTARGLSGRVAWPVLSGLMPPLADSYTPRTESGLALAGSLNPGESAVLVTADAAAFALGAMGGTGKTRSRPPSPTRCGTSGRSTCWSG
jgi:hypothetical protein